MHFLISILINLFILNPLHPSSVSNHFIILLLCFPSFLHEVHVPRIGEVSVDFSSIVPLGIPGLLLQRTHFIDCLDSFLEQPHQRISLLLTYVLRC